MTAENFETRYYITYSDNTLFNIDGYNSFNEAQSYLEQFQKELNLEDVTVIGKTHFRNLDIPNQPNDISEAIRNRLNFANHRFFANDNIADFIDEGDIDRLQVELEEKFREVLKTMIIDVDNDPNSMDTPRRLAKMYLYEILAGRYTHKPAATAFPNEDAEKYEGMVVIRSEITSLCPHHFQTVKGVAYIGLLPGDKVLGLSKYLRVAQWAASRPIMQEQLANLIAKEISAEISSEDVAVYLQAEHGCIVNRGVKAHSSLTQTTVLMGQFKNPDVKLEFMDHIKLQAGHKVSL